MTRRPEPETARRRSPVVWVCLLVLVEVVAYGAISALTADPTLRLLGALGVGVLVFVPLRHQIWGGDLATARERQRVDRPADRPAGHSADPRTDRPRRRR